MDLVNSLAWSSFLGCHEFNVTEKVRKLNHWTTEDGKLEAEVSFQPPHFNSSWITRLIFMVQDNETAIAASVSLFHMIRRDTLHVRCSSLQEKKETKTQTRILTPLTSSLEIPFRDIEIQVSCSCYLHSRSPTDTWKIITLEMVLEGSVDSKHVDNGCNVGNST